MLKGFTMELPTDRAMLTIVGLCMQGKAYRTAKSLPPCVYPMAIYAEAVYTSICSGMREYDDKEQPLLFGCEEGKRNDLCASVVYYRSVY